MQPHAHYLAEEVRGYATLPDGTRRPLIRIDDWDFHWQDFYRYRSPFVLPRGTELTMEFTYDNSLANPTTRFAPPRRVTWGQDSSNEMGDLWIQVVPRRPGDLDSLTRDRRPTELAEDIVGFEMELAADPDQVMMHDDVASLYLQFGQIEEAAAHYRESARLEPDSPAAAYNLGTALLQLRELDEAVAHLERSLDLNPDYALAHNNLGAAFRLKGRMGDAVRHFPAVARHPPRRWGGALQPGERADDAGWAGRGGGAVSAGGSPPRPTRRSRRPSWRGCSPPTPTPRGATPPAPSSSRSGRRP